MKNKYLVIMIVVVLLLSGCTITNINNLSNDQIVAKVLEEPFNRTNTALEGYKLYLPNGMKLVFDNNNNNILYADGDKYYLYVDLVSYYNKYNNDYKISSQNTAIYSKDIDYDNKKGYVLITKYEDKYFLEVMYNYSKIEVITTNVNKALANSLLVLKSVKFNDKAIESLIGNSSLNYGEEQFNLLRPKKEVTSFVEYIEDFGEYKEELHDEDKIDVNKRER